MKTLYVVPGHLHASSTAFAGTDPRGDKYELEPHHHSRYEVLILRHGDVISSPYSTNSITCNWPTPEVQVNSSPVELADNEPSESKNGVEDTPEDDDTEDEAAADDTVTEVPVTQAVTQPFKSQPTATPHLPQDRSLLVHETPTADRTVGISQYQSVETTPPPQAATADAEPFSTARTVQSPKNHVAELTGNGPETSRKRLQSSPEVRVRGRAPRKRSSPTTSAGPESLTTEPPSKRTKKQVSTEEDLGDIMPLNEVKSDPTRKTYSGKGKKRFSEVLETTPSRSGRSSQRSATTTAEAYGGDPPRVALSNSAINAASPTVKFLKKHGGVLVNSVEDKCNVLWYVLSKILTSHTLQRLTTYSVREGALSKTMKVIQAIALGVPIVTDKWLYDSAKADEFLDLSPYQPSVPEQEKEWQFDLSKVWGVAQTPFKGYTLYFTPALKKTYTNFKEMEQVCNTVGAKVASKRSSKSDKLIVLANQEEDPDTEKMIEEGETCYTKDLLTTSILRGTLDLESDEFKISVKSSGGVKKRTSRKGN